MLETLILSLVAAAAKRAIMISERDGGPVAVARKIRETHPDLSDADVHRAANWFYCDQYLLERQLLAAAL